MPGTAARLIVCPNPRCGKKNRIPVPLREGGEYRCAACDTVLFIAMHDEADGPREASFLASVSAAPQSPPPVCRTSGWAEDAVRLVVPSIVSILLLLLAVFGRWPYGFYTVLRFVVCGTAVYLACEAHQRASRFWPWTMGAIALLFNPVIVVRLPRADWQAVDFVVAIVFGVWVVACALHLVRGSRRP